MTSLSWTSKAAFCFAVLLYLFLCSCRKEEANTDNLLVKKDTVTKVIDDLKFKLNPTASDQFTFVIPDQDSKSYQLSLKKDNMELAGYVFEADNNKGTLNATVKYNFQNNESYDIFIRSIKENQDTVFSEEFTLKNYTHQYFNKFNYKKLATINQTIDFDISPSRNVIYYIDYINNKLILNRLSIADNTVEVLDEDFFSLLIRSKDDNRLIVSSRNYNNRFLGTDSCALLDYDVYSKQSSFIDWGSADYGRFSRVVNNSIMVSNPVLTGSISLINLADGTEKSYLADIRYLREYTYDNIYLRNDIFDFSGYNFTSRLTFLNSNSSISYYDKDSEYYITVEYFQASSSSPVYSRMIIYKNNEVVYEQPYEKGLYLDFPRLINMTDNKLIFTKSYDYDSNIRLDGYYLLDINTKEITLLQNESNYYLKNDFFIFGDKNSFISVRPYEIYKITVN